MKLFLNVLLISIIITGSVMAGEWTDNVKFKGDFRYRHEIVDQENKDIRHRHRIRARINLEGKVSDQAKVVVGISSGSHDPVSNNQTLTDAFSSKDLIIDVAYFEIQPEQVPGLAIMGGKTYNPFYNPGKSELIWDADLRQEGITADYSKSFDDISMRLIGSGLWIQERKADDDSYLAGGQALASYNLKEKKGDITVGASFFKYGTTQGYPVFYEDDPFGNTGIPLDTIISEDDSDTTLSGYVYANKYEQLEFFGAFSYKAGHIPVTIIGDFVTNTAADSLNNGWSAGIYVGKTKKPGSWEFSYIYREIDADAVIGKYTDSDFRGGGTDAKGHEFGAGYQLMDNTTFAVTYFNNEIGLNADESTNFQRWHLDMIFKF